MEIVKAKYEILGECPTDMGRAMEVIELAGRTAYQSQNKITEGSAKKFIAMIVKRNHLAVIEHSNLVIKILNNDLLITHPNFPDPYQLPFHIIESSEQALYIGGNYRAWLEIHNMPEDLENLIFNYLEPITGKPRPKKPHPMYSFVLDQKEIPLGMKRISVKFTVPRGISHELVRHRPCSFLQECVSGDTIVHPKERYTIKQLFDRKQTHYGKPHNKTIHLKSVNSKGEIIPNNIIVVFFKGKQDVYEVGTSLGYKIKTTENHRFQIPTGSFLTLSELKVGDSVNVDSRKVVHSDRITNISYVGKEDTYDISMASPNNNYIANGFVVHNSTRYCKYNNLQVIQPPGLGKYQKEVWTQAMICAEASYAEFIRYGARAEIARSVLPISLKTEIITTASVKEWSIIFDLRTTPAAHPEMRAIMIPLQEEFLKNGWL